MITFDADNGLHRPAPDADAQRRLQRLHDLGLDGPDEVFDTLAARLAEAADAPYAMVNIRTPAGQSFVGLHNPPADDLLGGLPRVGRTMEHQHGYCPVVMHRGKPLVLPNVFASPRFAGNPVVDMIGIRSYAGAPLRDEKTGLVLGTVCWVGTSERDFSTADAHLDLIKAHRDTAMELIYTRAAHLTTTPPGTADAATSPDAVPQ